MLARGGGGELLVFEAREGDEAAGHWTDVADREPDGKAWPATRQQAAFLLTGSVTKITSSGSSIQ
jgi:hypothetical protein